MAQSFPEHLKDIRKTLERFGQYDVKMQLSTLLTFLLVAEHEDDPSGFSTRDVQNRLGISNAAASRNTAYWAHGVDDMPGAGHGLIEVDFLPGDRRLRQLRLTPKGRALIRQLGGL